MAKSGVSSARQRGRPRGGTRGVIPDDLLRAFATCLEHKVPSEITLKEVAERAGTSQEMVRYYFGSKNGLITALLRERSDRFASSLAALERDILDTPGNPTQLLIGTVLGLYLAERAVSRISTAEFLKARSPIREQFLNNRAELVIGAIHRIVLRLIEAGVYAPGVDARRMAISIMTMISGPVTLLSALPASWVSSEELAADGWVNHLTAMVDRMCRPDGGAGAMPA